MKKTILISKFVLLRILPFLLVLSCISCDFFKDLLGELDSDEQVIVDLATSSMSDMNSSSAGGTNVALRSSMDRAKSNQSGSGTNVRIQPSTESAIKQVTGPCTYSHPPTTPLSFAASGFANPSAGHGWMSGNMNFWFYEDCTALFNMLVSLNCILGATTTSGDDVSGSLTISGTINMSASYATSINFTFYSGTTGFVVNNKTNTVNLKITGTGTSTGGTMTLTGTINGKTVNETTSY